jgi:predicted transcriptional regulator
VYATARTDLLELADKGFLEIGKSGRAMVFTPRPGLREYIEHGYGAK